MPDMNKMTVQELIGGIQDAVNFGDWREEDKKKINHIACMAALISQRVCDIEQAFRAFNAYRDK